MLKILKKLRIASLNSEVTLRVLIKKCQSFGASTGVAKNFDWGAQNRKIL